VIYKYQLKNLCAYGIFKLVEKLADLVSQRNKAANMGSLAVYLTLSPPQRPNKLTTLQSENPSFVLREIGKADFEARPIPKLRDSWDVRVQIEQTGICGSDLHYYDTGRIGGRVYKLLDLKAFD
jgi:hypothetical protein